MIQLDTNYLITGLPEESPQGQRVRDWLDSGEDVRTSAMVWAEFHCGPVSQAHVRIALALFGSPEPLLQEDAERGGQLFNATGRRRGSLADCLIAATCIRLGAELATENATDFARFEPLGLRLAR